MNTFLGFGKQYVEKHYQKTGQRVYLHLKRTRKPVKNKDMYAQTCSEIESWAVSVYSIRIIAYSNRFHQFFSSDTTDVLPGELRDTSASVLLVLSCCVDCPCYFCLVSFCFRSNLISIPKACHSMPVPLTLISPFLLNATEGRRHQLQCWGPPEEETNSLGYW